MKIIMLAPFSSVHSRRWASALNADESIDLVLFSADQSSVKIEGLELKTLPKLLKGLPKSAQFLLLGLWAKFFDFFYRADLVHAHYISSYGLAATLFFNKCILSVWGTDLQLDKMSSLKSTLVLRGLKKAKEVCATSEFLNVKLLNLGLTNTRVIPFGVDTALFDAGSVEERQREQRGGVFYMGSTKALSEVYGSSFLIELAHELINVQGKKLKLLLTGVDDCEQTYQRQIKALKLEGSVEILGQVDHSQMPHVYSRMHVACFPSTHESFGVSAIEAASMGLPVVAFDIEGLKEVVQDGVTGFLVPYLDKKAFLKALCELMEKPAYACELGRRGRAFVKESYSWESAVEKMLGVYREHSLKNPNRHQCK